MGEDNAIRPQTEDHALARPRARDKSQTVGPDAPGPKAAWEAAAKRVTVRMLGGK